MAEFHNSDHLDSLRSSILQPERLRALFRHLPARYGISHEPKIVFTTEEHGTSFNTLVRMIGGYEPTILLVRTEKGSVLGAYCSADWAGRHRQTSNFFGTGETFVFSFGSDPSRTEPKIYRWVGLQKIADEKVNRNENYYQCTADGLNVGCGALCLRDLHKGSSMKAPTFNNDPLADSEIFDIATVEVIAFPSEAARSGNVNMDLIYSPLQSVARARQGL